VSDARIFLAAQAWPEDATRALRQAPRPLFRVMY
jgi:hypothetical protein